jgi:hypothetical protein
VEHLKRQQHRREAESWKKVKLQTFSRGHCARYWIVAEKEGRGRSDVSEHLDEAGDAGDGE